MNQKLTPAVLFEDHIVKHAVQYFPDLKTQEVNVRLLDERRYRHSRFYRFEVSGSGRSFFILVKTPPLNSRHKDRPKLGPLMTQPFTKYIVEYRAMSKIHEYFTCLDDPRFGAVRPLDILNEHRAIFMEEVPDHSLRHLVAKTSHLKNPFPRGGPIDLALAFRNAGAWLCKFHAMPGAQSVKIHNGRRLDFINTINRLVDFHIKIDPRNLFLQKIAAQTVQDAMQIMPEELPLGVRHGDYGLPNILSSLDGKITVLDTMASRRSPIYEDLSYLLVGLKAKWSQVFSQKLAYNSKQFALYEREFLSGYFGQSQIPYKIIHLYEVQALLVRWSSKVFTLKEQSPSQNEHWREVQLWLMRRFFKSMLRDLSH